MPVSLDYFIFSTLIVASDVWGYHQRPELLLAAATVVSFQFTVYVEVRTTFPVWWAGILIVGASATWPITLPSRRRGCCAAATVICG